MRIFSGVSGQKFWQVIDGHVIHTTLHWAKKVMVKVWNMDRLVDYQVVGLAGVRVVVSKNPANSPVGLRSEGGVVSLDGHRSFVV